MSGSNFYNAEAFTDNDFYLARNSWRLNLCGNEETNDLSVPGMKNLLEMKDLDSEDLRRQLNRENAVILFGEKAPTESGELKLQYDQIFRMAEPYGTVGCRGYRSKELLDDVLYALDWMHDNMYGENLLTDSSFRSYKLFDWWDWYVGGPCPMMDTLMIIEDAIDKERILKYTRPMSFLRNEMCTGPGAAYAMTRIVTLTPLALLTNNRALLNILRDECADLLEEHDEGNNMRRDFCCMTHGMPYNVAYGVINLTRIGKVLQILDRTPLDYKIEKKYNLLNMIRYTFAPVMYKGRTLSPMNGRAMQYDTCASHLLSEFHYLFGLFGEKEDREICEIIRRHNTPTVKAQLISTFDEGVTLEEYRKINSFPGTRAAEMPKTHVASYARYYDALTNPEYETGAYTLGYMWYSGDICAQHRNNYLAGLRMMSSRSPGYECINGAHGDGWYTGDGALYLYTPGAEDEYTPKWWSHADKHFIPGTTIDARKREIMFFDKAYKSSKDFVGGVSLDDAFLTASMDYEAFHCEVDEGRPDVGYGRSWPIYPCTLTAKKSYFFFDRAIVCIGTDINADDGYDVHTVVENRLIPTGDILINGEAISKDIGKITRNDITRVYIPGTGGYLFPNGGEITVHIYENDGVKFISLRVEHGQNPQKGEYAYIVLPNTTKEEVDTFDFDDIEILENSSFIQAAREKHSGLTGMVFRKSRTFQNITAHQPMILMQKEKNDHKNLSVCDPTQKLTNFSFSFTGADTATSSDNCISIHGNTISVTCDSAKGRTYHITLK